ncbi:MAG TPA: alpha/beta hydrolase [Propionibacteriaceae bacterium]|nr:alpha/beta hydrolase [Propionibacteriaceae bacterium]
MFEGFIDELVDLGDVQLRVRFGGEGPPLLLIHGHPRTSATWHRVAPQLITAGFTVVCPDLRGYGQSSKPIIRDDHRQQAKRAVANDLAGLMSQFGLDQFTVVGHDRGGHVGFRLAMDHPSRVTGLVIIDAVPIIEALERCDAHVAQRWFDWFFFAQPETPERVISADPMAWYRPDPHQMGAENYAELVEVINDPGTVRAMLEDFRAALGVDREADRADRLAGRTIGCPTLVLWSRRGDVEVLYGDPLAVWKVWAEDLRGFSIDSGQQVAEENPDALVEALTDFLAGLPTAKSVG